MKKLLAIALIAASLTACNNGDKKNEETKTTSDTTVTLTAPKADTIKTVTDTTVKTTTTMTPAKDSTKK